MSDPYGYNQQQYGGYGQPPHQQQYPQHQGAYAPPQQPSYGQTNPYDQQQQYPQQQQFHQDQYSQNQQYSSYGPPSQGGFQHAQTPTGQYGTQYQSEHDQQRQEAYPAPQAGQQFPQQGAYNQEPYPGDPNAPDGAEGERGLKGAIAGGLAGNMIGKKTGNRFLSTVAGVAAGHFGEKKWKNK